MTGLVEVRIVWVDCKHDMTMVDKECGDILNCPTCGAEVEIERKSPPEFSVLELKGYYIDLIDTQAVRLTSE